MAKVEKKRGVTLELADGVYHLSGILDEYADFSALIPVSEPLKLNLKGIKQLNSIGIRNMLEFLKKTGSMRIEYYECPSEYVDQINMIPALLGFGEQKGEVKSLFIPFECQKCDHAEDTLKLIDEVMAELGSDGTSIAAKCPKCGGEMIVYNDFYFSFLSR